MRIVWNAMGDIRVAFILLLAASATLFTGAFYAGGHYSLFMQLNRQRIQDWLPGQLVERFDVVWWIPLLFLIMGFLGVNTFICATNRVCRLVRQRGNLPPGRLFFLSIPSLIHFVFILIMIGHLTTFTTGRWQTLPLSAGNSVNIASGSPTYRVETIDNRFFPDTSALNGRIVQTRVTLVDAGAQPTRLQYTQPVYRDGRYFLLDKIKKKKRRSEKVRVLPTPADENCNKAHVYATPGGALPASGQRLLIVSDPGLAIIISGLSLIMVLMIVFFVTKSRLTGPVAGRGPAKIGMVVLMVAALLTGVADRSAAGDNGLSLDAIESRISMLRPHPDFKDDRLGIIVIQQALISLKEGSGGIGACLVNERTGKIVATGRNRQYRPYFRSDLHAEMDLLTRYEEWVRKKGGKASGVNPRDCKGLVLVSSVEPCPMCLTRIINAGIKKMIFVTPDEKGGMVGRLDQLPPFWKTRARQGEYRQAVCSPDIQRLAQDLFDFSTRNWGMQKEGGK